MTPPDLPPGVELPLEVEAKGRRADFAQRLAVILVVGVVVLNAIITAYGVAQLLDLAAINRANGELIKSCTTPTGECYRRSQARTAELLGEPAGPINRVTVLVALCAQQHQSEEAILDCVAGHLDAQEPPT